MPIVKSFGVSDEACFVLTKILAVDQDGAQSAHTYDESTKNTTKPPISVKSLQSDGKDRSISTGMKSTDKIERNFNWSTGQCLFIHHELGMFSGLSLSNNNSSY